MRSPLQTYSEAAHLDHFALNAGDQQGVLTGTRLDQVAGVELDAIHFVPGSVRCLGPSRAVTED
jgi:hypothetical protein